VITTKETQFSMQTETDFKQEGSKILSEALIINSSLTDLALSCKTNRQAKRKCLWQSKHFCDKGNPIGLEGTRMISEALKVNTALTKLSLSC